MTGGPRSRWLKGACLLIDGKTIARIFDARSARDFAASAGVRKIDLSSRLAIPGFVQTHVHLCQTGARGKGDDLHLIDWLTKRIFPYEAALTSKTLRAAVRQGLTELLLSGTTCILDMGTVRHTEIIGEELEKSGIRAFFGKCLMDLNPSCAKLREDRREALRETEALARAWHKPGDRIQYAITPRFLLSCTDRLLRDAYELLRDFPAALYHTHASENPVEMAAVRRRCGTGNLTHLDRLGVIGPRTCLAHCVHVSRNEVSILKKRRAHVLHCP